MGSIKACVVKQKTISILLTVQGLIGANLDIFATLPMLQPLNKAINMFVMFTNIPVSCYVDSYRTSPSVFIPINFKSIGVGQIEVQDSALF